MKCEICFWLSVLDRCLYDNDPDDCADFIPDEDIHPKGENNDEHQELVRIRQAADVA